jgi:hypothetical protein
MSVVTIVWTRLRDVTVGTAAEVSDAGQLLLAGARAGAADQSRRAMAANAALRQRLNEAAVRGAAESEQARQRLAATLDAAITALATSRLVNMMVDAQLERILRPVVRTVLDDVLAQLESDPERVQALVRGQRDTMVDELVGRIRSGAAAGDTAVDRITARVLHREMG